MADGTATWVFQQGKDVDRVFFWEMDNSSVDPGWEIEDEMSETRPFDVPSSRAWGNRSPLMPGDAKFVFASSGEVVLCCVLEILPLSHRRYLKAATCIPMVLRHSG